MRNLMKSLLGVKREEMTKTVLMFLYFFLTLVTLYILKPVRDSLFLVKLGADYLRYEYLGEGVFLMGIAFLYVKLSKRLEKNVFFTVTTAFFVLNLLLFRWLFQFEWPWISYFFYIWVACFSITAVTQFWTLANDIYNPREARRVFGLIISAGSLGGITGGLITNKMVSLVGTENLLIIASGILCFCILIINLVWKSGKNNSSINERKESQEKAPETSEIQKTSALKLLFSSKYLVYLLLLVSLTKIISVFIDNQWKAVVGNAIVSKNEMTAFMGGFSIWLNAVSLIMQLVVTRFSLRFLGIGVSLLLLPIGVTLGSAAIMVFPFLMMGAVAKIYDKSMFYSIYQACREILYLPVKSEIRYKVKPVIDMLGYRLSSTLAGGLIIFLTFIFGITKNINIGYLTLLLAPLWFFVAINIKKQYLKTIKDLLSSKKTIDEEPGKDALLTSNPFVDIQSEKTFEKIKEFLNTNSTQRRKLSAAACAAYNVSRDLNRVRILVNELVRYEAFNVNIDVNGNGTKEGKDRNKKFLDEYFINLLQISVEEKVSVEEAVKKADGKITRKLKKCLLDKDCNVLIRRKAVDILEYMASEESFEVLLESLEDISDNSLRFNVIRALNRINIKNENMHAGKESVKNQLRIEIGTYRRIHRVLVFYRRNMDSSKSEAKSDHLLLSLEAISVECLERIFRLLSLMYDPAILRVIYERMIENDEYIRSHAIELLDNILEPDVSDIVFEVLDEDLLAAGKVEKIGTLLANLITGEDRWLAVCSMMLVAKFGMQQHMRSIDRALKSHDKLVREAARISKTKLEAFVKESPK